jgi:hypothetical protein
MDFPVPVEICAWCGLPLVECEDRRNGTICPEYSDPDETESESEPCDCGACTACVPPWNNPESFDP